MKFSIFGTALITLCVMSLTYISCGNKSGNSEMPHQGIEYTSAYICPMHCEGSGSVMPGTCPVCGMDYVKNPNHTHACPMHPEITGVKGDNCTTCGMPLTEISGDDHEEHEH